MIKALILPQGDFSPAQAIQLVIKLNQEILDELIRCVKHFEVFTGVHGTQRSESNQLYQEGIRKIFLAKMMAEVS